jgi:VCBS repeat-containing protein
MAVTLTTIKPLVGGTEDQYYAITYARLLMNGNESSTTDGFLIEPGASGTLSYMDVYGVRQVIDFTSNPEVVLRLNGLYINNVKVSGSDSKLYWLNDEGFQGGDVTALNLQAVNTLTRTWGNGDLGGIETSGTSVPASLAVAAVNDAPTTSTIVLAHIAEDSGARVITSSQLLAAAEDVDGDTLTVSNLQISSGGGQLIEISEGTWSYTPAVDDDTGVSFTYTISDGTATIQGSATLDITPVAEGGNNVPTVITGVSTAALIEADAALTTGGTLIATDPDSSNAFVAQTDVAGSNGYGSFSIGTDGVWTYAMNSAQNAFVAGTDYTDSITVATVDGTTKVITVTIAGTDDATVITGVSTAALIEADAALTTGGTLIATDPDSSNAFVAQTDVAGSNGYGSFSIGTDGVWTYAMNSAQNAFVAGTDYTDSITVATVDGTTKVITVTIAGTDDLPVLTGDIEGAVTEDDANLEGSLFAYGAVSITDVDNNVAEYAFDEAVVSSQGALGSLTINAEGHWTYSVANDLLQYLKQGQEKVETFTVTAGGGFSQDITITVTGTNDVPNITGSTTGAVQEHTNISFGTLLTTNGLLNITDADAGEAFFQTAVTPAVGVLGNLAITNQGAWSYSVSNSLVEDLNLNERRDEQFTVLSLDGTPKVITVTITGTNDVPVISFVAGNDAGAVKEDTIQTVSGVLTATDADTTAVLTWSIDDSVGAYGSLALAGNSGNWTYTLANGTNGTASEVQSLKQGQTETDSFTVIVTDEHGAKDEQTVTVTITGTNDAPVIAVGGDAATISEDDEESLTVTGILTATDIDDDADLTWSIQGEDSGVATGTYGTLTQVDGTWTYTLNNAAENVQALYVGQKVTDTFTVIVSDGLGGTDEQDVTVTITGTNDAPVIAEGGAAGSISEDANELTVTGTLTATDVDNGAALTWSIDGAVSGIATGTYGSLTQVDGAWTYTLNNAAANVQALTEGQPVNDTFKVTVVDGLGGTDTQDVTVTITGTNDAPVINVIEQVALNEQSNTAALTSTINVTFTDIDLTDVGHSASIATASASGVTHPSLTEEALKALISVGDVSKTSGSTAGSLSLGFSAASSVFDYLSVDQVVTLYYSVAVNDGDTGTDTQTFSITITGTNDKPVVLESSVVTRTVTERDDGAINENSGNLTVSGSINFADVDLSDILHGAEITVAPIGDEVLGTLYLNGGVDEAAVNQAADSIAWTYSVNAGQLDKLKASETLTQAYVVRISDVHGGFVDQTVTITIVGTNDAPIVTLNSNSAAFTEDTSAVFVEDILTLSASGTLSYTDDDLGITDGETAAKADSHSINSSSFSYTWTEADGTTPVTTLSGPQLELFSGALASDINQIAKTGTWDFSVLNSDVQFLGEGEILTLSYNVVITDSSNAANKTDTKVVTITLTGTNDAPVIDVENSDISAGLIEDAVADEDDLETQGVDESTHLVATGAVVFSDLDINDEHVVTLVLEEDGIAYSAGPLLDGDALLAIKDAITVSTDTNGWNFAIANSAVQFLGAGETLTLTFDLSVTDNSGVLLSNVATETVTITLTGTNDAPVIDVENSDISASLTEGAVALENDLGTAVDDTTHLVATGDVVFSDLDINDTHTVALVLEGEGVGIVYSGGELGIDALAAIKGAITAGAGLNSWNFAIANSAVQFLGAGETLTLSFALSVTDNSGAENNAATETVTITITGTNDRPSLVVGSADQSLAEDVDVEGVLSATGALTVTDFDITDTHEIEFALDAATVAGDALTGDALTAIEDAITARSNVVDDQLQWEIDIANAAVQFLAADEQLKLTFKVTAVDDSEADNATSEVQTITITVIGTNDVPVIADVTTVQLTEQSDTQPLTETITVTFSDADFSDGGHTASITGAVVKAESGFGPELESVALAALISVTTVTKSAGTDAGSVALSFSAASGVFDYLASGESVTLTYTVEVNDLDGGVISKDFDVTINGTNDQPVLTLVSDSASLFEDLDVDGMLAANSALSVTDVDAIAQVPVTHSVESTSWMKGQQQFILSSEQATALTSGFTASSLGWNYSVANEVVQFLGNGESVTLSFNVTATDGSGALNNSTTEVVTITINGTNDAPIITTGNLQVTALVDGTVESFSLADRVVIADVDANDVLTVNLRAVMGTLTIDSESESELQFSDNGEGGLQLSGTAQKVNAAIATLMFTPDSELGAAAALYVEVTDSANVTATELIDFVVLDEDMLAPVPLDINVDFTSEDVTIIANYTTDTIVTIKNVSASSVLHNIDVDGTTIQHESINAVLLLEGFTGDLDGNSVLFADGSVLKTSSVKANLVGSAVEGGDYLKGSDSNDVLRGMAGNDKLEGGGGNDTIYGGTGADIIYGGKGNDILYAGDTTANDVAQDIFAYDLEGVHQGTDLIIGFANDQDKIGILGQQASMNHVQVVASIGSTAVVKLYSTDVVQDQDVNTELATIKLLGMAGLVDASHFLFMDQQVG